MCESGFAHPRMTLVIITHNREQLFKKALKSVEKALQQIPEPVTLRIYNSSRTALNPPLGEELHVPELETAVRKREQAIRDCRTEWILFLDDDCEIQPGALKTITDRLDHDEKGKFSAYFGRIIFSGPKTIWFTALDKCGYFHVFNPGNSRETPWSPTALSVFRTEDIAKCAGFDVDLDLPAGGEDVDICLQLRSRGGHLGAIQETLVAHTTETWNTWKGNVKRAFNYGMASSVLQLKWPEYRAWDASSLAGLVSGWIVLSCILNFFHSNAAGFALLYPAAIFLGEFIYTYSLTPVNPLFVTITTLIQLSDRIGYFLQGIKLVSPESLFRQFDWTYLNSFETRRSGVINRAVLLRWLPPVSLFALHILSKGLF